jgi:tRNA1Val (adenine37-N6)-methyltransferase
MERSLFCFHAGLDEFVEEPEDEYDLIVSNPPFYTEDYKLITNSVI